MQWTPNEKRIIKHRCENSLLDFTRYFFPDREGGKFEISPHHLVLANNLQRTIEDDSFVHLMINIPPGYTKTELAVINYIAYGIATHPSSRYLHLSFSERLALHNSDSAKGIVKADKYQEFWPTEFLKSTDSKNDWKTKGLAYMVARSIDGQVTGKRAGRIRPGFTGAILIDDPNKPKDTKSKLMLSKINDQYNITVKSRAASRKYTRIIIIAQRTHDNDLCGHLLRGGAGHKWNHLMLPGVIDNSVPYPKRYTHGIPIDHGLPDGPLWDSKLDLAELQEIKESAPYTYSAQYMQDPLQMGSNIFKEKWWEFYDYSVKPSCELVIMTADTACKTGQANDFTVFQIWGLKDKKAILLDQVRGKYEAPELLKKAHQLINKWYVQGKTYNQLRRAHIEDAVSGTGLIQQLNKEAPIPIVGVRQTRDKYTRACDMSPFVEAGRVVIPRNAPWTLDFINEFTNFTDDDSHDHDDQIDPAVMAVAELLQRGAMTSVPWGR